MAMDIAERERDESFLANSARKDEVIGAEALRLAGVRAANTALRESALAEQQEAERAHECMRYVLSTTPDSPSALGPS